MNTSTTTTRRLCRIILFALAMLLPLAESPSLAAPMAPMAPASSYSCRTTHCYERLGWYVSNLGGYNTQTIPTMTCTDIGCTNGDQDYIDNEMWVVDNSTWADNQCNYQGFAYGDGCWVETGVKTSYNGHAVVTIFFWADVRPCNGGYAVHVGPAATSYIGGAAAYAIRATSTGTLDSCNDPQNSTFNVSSVTFSDLRTQMNGNSTRVPISPVWVVVGSELQGTTGESESGAHQNAIQYYQASSWNNVNPYAAFDESTQGGNPMVGTWTYPDSTNTGDWAVSCGC